MARIVLDERPIGCWDCPFYALFDCRHYRDDQIFPGYCEYITTPDELKESKTTVWHDAQNDPPKENGEYLCYYEYFRYGNYNCMYRTMDRGYFFNGQWSGEPTHGTSAKVLAWTELPAPPTKE